MKNKSLLLISLLIHSTVVFGQKVMVEYDLQYCSNGDFEQYKSKLSIYKNNNSVFEIFENTIAEGVNFTTNNGHYEISVVGSTESNRKIIKNFTTQQYHYYKQHLDDVLKISDSIGIISWDIAHSETRTILDLECKKATGKHYGREYTAWYTTKIPYGDGPWKFSGLPGTILNVSDTENCLKIEAEKITIDSSNEAFLNTEPTFTKSLKWPEYLSFMQFFFKKDVQVYRKFRRI